MLVADDAVTHALAENVAPLVASVADGYGHIIAPATTTGKNFMPRVAALLDVNMLSDITAVVDAKTFERPIYAGNATATVQNNEAKVLITVRTTAFDAAGTSGNAAVETVTPTADAGKSSFVSQGLATSTRPELTSAAIVVSGGRAVGSGENLLNTLSRLPISWGAAVEFRKPCCGGCRLCPQ